VKYTINDGARSHAIRMGCEKGVYQFVRDYSKEMGMSMSAACRRLILIGARCEAEHGKQTMPASYAGLRTGPKQLDDNFFDKFEAE
jgi:hypothetical protein